MSDADRALAEITRAESLLKNTGRDANRARELAQIHATLAIANALLDIRASVNAFAARYLRETER